MRVWEIIHLTEDKLRWRPTVNTTMNLPVERQQGTFQPLNKTLNMQLVAQLHLQDTRNEDSVFSQSRNDT